MKGSNASASIVYEKVGDSEDPSREIDDAAGGNSSPQADDEVGEARIASHSGESATPSALRGSPAHIDSVINTSGVWIRHLMDGMSDSALLQFVLRAYANSQPGQHSQLTEELYHVLSPVLELVAGRFESQGNIESGTPRQIVLSKPPSAKTEFASLPHSLHFSDETVENKKPVTSAPIAPSVAPHMPAREPLPSEIPTPATGRGPESLDEDVPRVMNPTDSARPTPLEDQANPPFHGMR